MRRGLIGLVIAAGSIGFLGRLWRRRRRPRTARERAQAKSRELARVGSRRAREALDAARARLQTRPDASAEHLDDGESR